MLKDSFAHIFEKDLKRLKDELSLYPDESLLWQVKPGVTNSGGNLALHLLGNLNHFIGALIGGNGYVRNREAEFGFKNVPRKQLLADIEKTIDVVKESFGKMKEADMHKEFPERKGTIESNLVHFVAHFNYHLGQINYHRRIIAG
jgi:hypothetical protein